MTWFTHQRARACAVVGLVLFLLLDWLPWMIQDQLAPSGKRQAGWIFWFQTVSGNWAPTTTTHMDHGPAIRFLSGYRDFDKQQPVCRDLRVHTAFGSRKETTDDVP